MLLFNAARKRCASCLYISLFSMTMLLSAVSAASQKHTKTAEPVASVEPAKPGEPHSKLDELLKGMKFRNIGPYRGGRSLTASGVPGDPNVYYFGSTGGGV